MGGKRIFRLYKPTPTPTAPMGRPGSAGSRHRARVELTQQARTLASRASRFLALDAVDEDPMTQLLGHSITYCIAVEPQAGRKVFMLQTLPACEPEDQFGDTPGLVAGFSLHADVTGKAHEWEKLERLCR